MSTKCIVELTKPDTSLRDCPMEDTDDYLHSLGGFRPCFFYDFESKYEWRYKLDCRSMTANGLVMTKPQHVGYEYVDVLIPPKNVTITDAQPIQNPGKVVVSVDFRDWKWLSQYTRF